MQRKVLKKDIDIVTDYSRKLHVYSHSIWPKVTKKNSHQHIGLYFITLGCLWYFIGQKPDYCLVLLLSQSVMLTDVTLACEDHQRQYFHLKILLDQIK